MQKNRPLPWGFELRQLTFWLSVVLVGGAIPDLLIYFGDWRALVAGWATAGVVAFLIWNKMARKSGVGVFIHIPQRKGDPKDSNILLVNKRMSEEHIDWFMAGPDNPEYADDAKRRAEWMVKTIQHHLRKTRINPAMASTLYFYLYSQLEDAFAMGAHFTKQFSVDTDGLHDLNGNLPGKWRISPAVRYLAIRRQKREIYEIDIGRLAKLGEIDFKGSGSIDETIHTLHDRTARDGSARLRKLAILIYVHQETDPATSNGDRERDPKRASNQELKEGNEETRRSPKKNSDNQPECQEIEAYRCLFVGAASGRVPHNYDIKEDDLCDNAIAFSLNSKLLEDLLTNGQGHEFLRYLNKRRAAVSRRLYGTEEVPVRLFLKGPAIVAFAAGAIFPQGSRLVPWKNSATNQNSPKPKVSITPNPDFVAIVDGDNIGSPMESHLLSGELKSAITYSESVSSELAFAFHSIGTIPGVELLSTGGDSAIFGIKASSISSFQEKLDEIRLQNPLSLSCGWGIDARSAFMGLRISKTSGKNITSMGR
ncbi:hypothetical protein [Actinoalloteichus hymeniacidonis]|uniref:Minimal CRISPR polymerase domain-containing protein n=1 Tax=Actinoalloteichus hymeniacidonis TaxID=340345 RepID=A0AAC9HTL3_9PSEU|nr:hypothetical protein [Actinoalloteichus hymeniacidonis]AOS64265.1 hypothetical protein TL08_17325 [Actinoalloteichus hymeniacidonis]MBB5907667.1 hypothetical protein [Actinoalloteichus hymeniacidonis]